MNYYYIEIGETHINKVPATTAPEAVKAAFAMLAPDKIKLVASDPDDFGRITFSLDVYVEKITL